MHKLVPYIIILHTFPNGVELKRKAQCLKSMVNLTTERTANSTILLACTLLFHSSSAPQVPISNIQHTCSKNKFADRMFSITYNSSEQKQVCCITKATHNTNARKQ